MMPAGGGNPPGPRAVRRAEEGRERHPVAVLEHAVVESRREERVAVRVIVDIESRDEQGEHHQLVFDTATGERLELAELFAGGGVDADMGLQVTEEVVRIVTAVDLVRIRQARPTLDGLVFGFSPYEAGGWSDYTRDVTIPWHVYRMAEGSR